jgi:hypothetical protein
MRVFMKVIERTEIPFLFGCTAAISGGDYSSL